MERRNEYGLLIGGEWVAAEGGKTSETRNPATGEVLARVAAASRRRGPRGEGRPHRL